jgi:hypothetical protein
MTEQNTNLMGFSGRDLARELRQTSSPDNLKLAIAWFDFHHKTAIQEPDLIATVFNRARTDLKLPSLPDFSILESERDMIEHTRLLSAVSGVTTEEQLALIFEWYSRHGKGYLEAPELAEYTLTLLERWVAAQAHPAESAQVAKPNLQRESKPITPELTEQQWQAELTQLKETEVQATTKVEQVAQKLLYALQELGFTVLNQERLGLSYKEQTKAFSSPAKYLAVLNFPVEKGGSVLTLAFTPFESRGRVYFSAKTYVNDQDWNGNHDFSSGELVQHLINSYVGARMNVTYGQVGWPGANEQLRQVLRDKLQPIANLTYPDWT